MAYLYFKSLTDERPFGWQDYIWIFPALFVGGGVALLSILIGEENVIAYIQEVLDRNTLPSIYNTTLYQLHYLLSIRLYNFFILSEAIIISTYATISIIRYRHRLKDFYSNLEGKSMENNYAVLISFLVTLLFSLLFTLNGRFFFRQNPMVLIPLLIGWASTLYYMCYHASQLKYTADRLAEELARVDQETIEEGYLSPEDMIATNPGDDTSTDSYTNSKKKINPQLIAQFNHLINEEKIYLQNDLRLDDMVRLMRTNRTYISRLINEEYHNSFSDFINSKRIAYAQELMLADRKITQETVALQSGFSHVSSFSRTFKQQIKMTPGKWLKYKS